MKAQDELNLSALANDFGMPVSQAGPSLAKAIMELRKHVGLPQILYTDTPAATETDECVETEAESPTTTDDPSDAAARIAANFEQSLRSVLNDEPTGLAAQSCSFVGKDHRWALPKSNVFVLKMINRLMSGSPRAVWGFGCLDCDVYVEFEVIPVRAAGGMMSTLVKQDMPLSAQPLTPADVELELPLFHERRSWTMAEAQRYREGFEKGHEFAMKRQR